MWHYIKLLLPTLLGFVFVEAFSWVHSNTSKSHVPADAVVGGSDVDGSTIYIGRAHHEGDLLPAKVIPSHHACFVTYAGDEISKTNFEVLVRPRFTWVSCCDGDVPAGAVSSGETNDREKLYIGRVDANGAVTPGKVHPSQGCCYYPFGGTEVKSTCYECLVVENM